MEQSNEIQESLGRSYAVPDEIDEADLEAGTSPVSVLLVTHLTVLPELDALALEEDEEGPSYLADLNKVPDFIDEPPVAVGEVCDNFFSGCQNTNSYGLNRPQSGKRLLKQRDEDE